MIHVKVVGGSLVGMTDKDNEALAKMKEGSRWVIDPFNPTMLRMHNLLHAYIEVIGENTNASIETVKYNSSFMMGKENKEFTHGKYQKIKIRNKKNRVLEGYAWIRGSFSYKNNTKSMMEKLLIMTEYYGKQVGMIGINEWVLIKKSASLPYKKVLIAHLQNGLCAITGEELPPNLHNVDLHHPLHNNYVNKNLYKYFTNSILNLYAVKHGDHMVQGEWIPHKNWNSQPTLKKTEEIIRGLPEEEREVLLSPTEHNIHHLKSIVGKKLPTIHFKKLQNYIIYGKDIDLASGELIRRERIESDKH